MHIVHHKILFHAHCDIIELAACDGLRWVVMGFVFEMLMMAKNLNEARFNFSSGHVYDKIHDTLGIDDDRVEDVMYKSAFRKHLNVS